jgi:L,D-peptidoglycan transpeptidase YkuD (ErfK/YbiS/YcfS/YnhG family)
MIRLIVVGIFLLTCASSSFSDNFPSFLNQPQLSGSRQVVVVQSIKGEVFKAHVSLWQKQGNEWRIANQSMEAVVGIKGIAAKGEKREGDGKTPSGIFELEKSFGYAPTIDTRMKYTQVTDQDIWIDDVHSKDYNQWKSIHEVKDVKSFEQLKRNDELYMAAIVIEYNTSPVVPGLGSAIFLHIWRNFDKPTAGCVALSKENVLKLLKWLDPVAKPLIAIEP